MKHTAILGLATVALLLSGCGSKSAARPNRSPTSAAAATSTKTAGAIRLHIPPRSHLNKAAYIKTVRGLAKRLTASIQGLYPIETGIANSSVRKTTLTHLHTALASVTVVEGAMIAIVPPSEIKTEHAALTKDVRGTAATINTMILSLGQDDLRKFLAISSFDDLRRFYSTAAKLAKMGYRIV